LRRKGRFLGRRFEAGDGLCDQVPGRAAKAVRHRFVNSAASTPDGERATALASECVSPHHAVSLDFSVWLERAGLLALPLQALVALF